jgi:PAS domain S-box-containing protein
VLDILAEAVTIRDRDGSIVYANRAALESMGFETMDDLKRRSSRAIMDDYVVEDEHGEPLTLEDVPSMRLMQGRTAPPLLMHTVSHATGQSRWRLLKTTPIPDGAGTLVAAVTVIEDVTAVKTAELRTRVLAESGRVLASSLDYEQTLENVARVVLPALADWCAIDLFDEHVRREHAVTTHRDPSKVEFAHRLRELEADHVEAQSAVWRVLRTGVSELVPDITDELLARSATSAEHLELLRQLQARSAVMVPMSVPGRTIGVLTLVTAESLRRLTQDDLELAEQLGRRAAVAVENARLHTTLAGVAEILQRSLRPEELPEVPGWELASLYRPAGSDQQIDVGGDFYEIIPNDAGWLCLIGDVTGNGVTAAALTGLLRHGARFASRFEPDPAAILRRLDEDLRQHSERIPCSALCVRLHEQKIVLSSAGHPPALLARPGGEPREAPEAGPLLGAFDDAEWSEHTLLVGPEELVLIYTDGVIETPGEDDRFGGERLRRFLSHHASASPAELLDRLDAALDAFRSGPRQDDVVALALRPRPASRPAS